MEDRTFIVHSDWLDCIADLPVEQQDQVIAEIVRYGTEMESRHSEDVVVQAFVNMVKGRIDFSKDKYAQKVEAGNKAGRKKSYSDAEVWKIAQTGKNSTEIGLVFGVSKSTIDRSEGWKQRKNKDFLSNLSK